MVGTYDPHDDVDLLEEMALMTKGRLVKARLPDQAPPNVGWYWFALGNCSACQHFTNQGGRPRCLDPKISEDDFLNLYSHVNTCPEFEAGLALSMAAVDGAGYKDGLDVMRAVGLVPGAPSQRVLVLVDSPWTIDLAIRAHREASVFLDLARAADYIARGGSNDPARGEYVDLADDLERPVRDGAPPPAPEPAATAPALTAPPPAAP